MRLRETDLNDAIRLLAQAGRDHSAFSFSCEGEEHVGAKERFSKCYSITVSAQGAQRTYQSGPGTNWLADFGKDLPVVWPVQTGQESPAGR